MFEDPLTFLYRTAVGVRNYLYDRGILKIHRAGVPVISVGNLSVGGTGKSSLTAYLAGELSKRLRVCILLRGYRRRSRGTLVVSEWGDLRAGVEEAGDEAYMFGKLLKNVLVIVSENRAEGARLAKRMGAQIIILDDGFQHRRLYRDLDIVLIRKRDVAGRLLPFGRLREPLDSLRRADAIVLSYQEIEPFDFSLGDKPIFKMTRSFTGLIDCSLRKYGFEFLEGKRVVAFAGLGDNEQFFKALERLGISPFRTFSFRDHHDYRNFKIEKDYLYLTTLKDLFKLPPSDNLYALSFELEVPGLLEFITCKISC